MKFEVINISGKKVMCTSHFECIPSKAQIEDMLKTGYKIKVDNKILTKKNIEAFLDGKETNGYEDNEIKIG